MKLIVELIEFALKRGWLTDEEKLYLETEGYYAFDWSDQARRHDPLEIDEEEILGARSHSSNHRGKSSPSKPRLTAGELNQRVQEEWKKLAEQFPRYQALWDSWKAGRLAQVFDDGFTLNDVYALLSVELCDFHDFSGPAPTAFRQLLKQEGATMGKYSWVVKCPEMAAMVEFLPFRQQLFDDVKTLYKTDRERFISLSSQNGKLDFPNWEKAVQTDTTSMKVWSILKIDFEPVEQDKIPDILTWKTALAFAMQLDCDFVTELLSELEKWDRDSSTVITANKLKYVILKSVTIPDGTREIGWFAFGYCRSLTSVVIPEGVMEIRKMAFFDCSSLTSVVIPEGVRWIEDTAFLCCPNLTIHAPAGSYAEGFAKWKGIPFETE